MVGNFEVDVAHQQRVGHLLGPLPPEMRNDTAFMDRIHAYIPGWDIPKLNAEHFTNHFGLVSDFLSLCWNALRSQSRVQNSLTAFISVAQLAAAIRLRCKKRLVDFLN